MTEETTSQPATEPATPPALDPSQFKEFEEIKQLLAEGNTQAAAEIIKGIELWLKNQSSTSNRAILPLIAETKKLRKQVAELATELQTLKKPSPEKSEPSSEPPPILEPSPGPEPTQTQPPHTDTKRTEPPTSDAPESGVPPQAPPKIRRL